MSAVATVSIDNNFSPRQSTVTLWAPDDKTTGRINEVFRVTQKLRWNSFFDTVFDDVFLQLLVSYVGCVLRGYNDCFNSGEFASFILCRDLAFGIRPEKVDVFRATKMT